MAGELIRQGKYPDVTQVDLGDIITKCWSGEYTSAKEVADDINNKVRAIFNFKRSCSYLNHSWSKNGPCRRSRSIK
jgi:hypothetical protein